MIEKITNRVFVTFLSFVVLILPLVSSAQISEVIRVVGSDIDPEIGSFSMTPDGRYIVFSSASSNIVAGDTNGSSDVFFYDADLDSVERISIGTSGSESNGSSSNPTISDDGRYIAFNSSSSNLIAGDTNGLMDVFVYDRVSETNERVSLSDSGDELVSGGSSTPFISGNGRYVAFYSEDTDVIAGDANADDSDVFVYDRTGDTIELVSKSSGGVWGNNSSSDPIISYDGRYVAFDSASSNLVAGDTNNSYDIFLHDRDLGTTEVVSVDDSGTFSDADCSSPVMSTNGRYVAFDCTNTAAWTGDGLASGDSGVFIYDRTLDDVTLVSTAVDDTLPDDRSFRPYISGDGRYVLFTSDATNLVSGDVNGMTDYFLKDTLTGLVERVSEGVDGEEPDGNATKDRSKISTDGRYIVFRSAATNLVENDINMATDLFRVKVTDNDGISDAEEEAGPNGGDGDEDGYSDSMEHDTTAIDNSVTGDYALLVSAGGCFDNQDAALFPESSLSTQDNEYAYPTGILDFGIKCRTTSGDSADVTIHLLGAIDTTGLTLRKISSATGISTEVSGASINQTTVDGEPAVEITYTVTDGGPLDEDGLVNGVIIDPVGLAEYSPYVPGSSGGNSSGNRPRSRAVALAPTQTPEDISTCHVFTTFMKFGSRYGEVSNLQTLLNSKDFDSGPVDAWFGKLTLAAVKNFQTANGLVSDGIVGPMTRAKLNICN